MTIVLHREFAMVQVKTLSEPEKQVQTDTVNQYRKYFDCIDESYANFQD